MPFSRSRSIESSTRSLTSWLARNAPDCHSRASTSVVLPWSTWAMIARLRMSVRAAMSGSTIARVGVTPALKVLGGVVAVDGLAISSRTGWQVAGSELGALAGAQLPRRATAELATAGLAVGIRRTPERIQRGLDEVDREHERRNLV